MEENGGEQLSVRIKTLDRLVKGDSYQDVSTTILSQDGLLDSLLTLYGECSHEQLMRNKYVAAFVKQHSSAIRELQKLRIKCKDFEVKDVIGRGHFGEVQVVTEKSSGTVYAMKILSKHETLAQQEISFYEEERDIMAKATSPWITRLHYAFQDQQNLYLVMEFHAGGDLLSLLSRNDDIFEEDMARFYLAEMSLAIDALHCMGYVHRDIKPENILLDWHGHVKLADFGSSAKLSPDMLVSSRMPVGTPDYVSPELLTSMNDQQRRTNYGVEVDWWSLGICMYEMLFGKTPFTDENGSMVFTYSNIMNFQKCLSFPDDNEVSASAVDLIRKLLTDKDNRLTYKGIVNHRFFSTINFKSIREETPPFVPHLNSLDDTSNFEEFEKVRYQPVFDNKQSSKDFSGKDLPFVGFTFVRKEGSENSPKKDKLSDTSSSLEANYEVTLTVKIKELQNMRHRCNQLEETECDLKNKIEKLTLELKNKDEELTKTKIERDSLDKEMQTYCNKAETLKQQTEVEELQEVVVQLETDKESLLRKLSNRDKQIESYKEQLTSIQSQMSKLQYRLDKERRKSRDDQKRDLVLLETREEMWRSQVDDKNSDIVEMRKKIQK
ncbi:hypothetical protein KUTeg_008336 [Tegillarca granosa]|uniref:non-specific serine/threonine protein kinase n=1 Tax=Tegillarca granosa TaxID=220873 RepID=A0ABQ9F8W7_TEGGR|nr:hypothetical protein KUTeg_008336 [Tegillarca granosa]